MLNRSRVPLVLKGDDLCDGAASFLFAKIFPRMRSFFEFWLVSTERQHESEQDNKSAAGEALRSDSMWHRRFHRHHGVRLAAGATNTTQDYRNNSTVPIGVT
ncbi:unnamed protein product [Ectocarpus sp. 4 AP-2014]